MRIFSMSGLGSVWYPFEHLKVKMGFLSCFNIGNAISNLKPESPRESLRSYKKVLFLGLQVEE
jgi:hypothetical protein